MAPLWRWSEELRPRAGKDEELSVEDSDQDSDKDSQGRKQFVPFNRLVIKLYEEKMRKILYLLFSVSLTMQQILKSTSKKKDQDKSAQSWWKKNKRRKPVKYDIQSLFGKSGLDKDSFKWYYPDTKTEVASSSSISSTEDPAIFRTESTIKTTTPIPGMYVNSKEGWKQLLNKKCNMGNANKLLDFQKSEDVSCNFTN